MYYIYIYYNNTCPFKSTSLGSIQRFTQLARPPPPKSSRNMGRRRSSSSYAKVPVRESQMEIFGN